MDVSISEPQQSFNLKICKDADSDASDVEHLKNVKENLVIDKAQNI